MKLAYLSSTYARESDTFVRNEVIELLNRGHEVFTFSIRKAASDKNISPELAFEQANTDYILEHSKLKLLSVFFGFAVKHPSKIVQAVKLAYQTHGPGLKGTLVQIAYLIEATYLASRLKALDVTIVHNHIPENSANVAMLASLLSDIPYSMTVHGPGIFFNPQKWALGEKIARSAFTAAITDFCKSQRMLFSAPKHWHKFNIVRCSVNKSFESIEITPIPSQPGIPDLIADKENGWLVSTGSVKKLSAAIKEVCLADTKQLQLMGDKGAIKVKALHTLSTQIDTLESLLIKCAKKQSLTPMTEPLLPI